ncbi:MAG: sulfurtransferase TusA family protein [Candidatus Lokiarchaeota archaeon]|nr:sulfurtransferase TusA family protein [Candidatus Harpocratesius repetitus]
MKKSETHTESSNKEPNIKPTLKPTETLDCIGVFCPEPLFQTRSKIDDLNCGDILEVFADDPASKEDLTRFCKRTGHILLKVEENAGEFRFLIQKK